MINWIKSYFLEPKSATFINVELLVWALLMAVSFSLGYGWGMLILTMWYIGVTVSRQWFIIMAAMRNAEGLLFGRPLDRQHWQDGAKPKLRKMVWRKKKDETNK